MKNGILLALIVLSLVASVGYTYYRTVVLQDFTAVNLEGAPTDPNGQ